MAGNRYYEAGKTVNQANNDRQPYIPPIALGSKPELIESSHQDAAPDAAADPSHDDWLSMARDAYLTSESYFDASIRAKTERNLAHFNNRHAPGSKYYTDLYKYRARGFRPKTRSVIRKNEAKAAIALFSTSDAVNVEAENDANKNDVISAEVNHALLSYRLKESIPWFQLALGAYQDTLNTGVCISHQYWDYQEARIPEVLTGDNGETVLDHDTGKDAIGYRKEVIVDTPRIELRPIENIRFSPAADWADPINSSPYLIDMIPMEIGDIKVKVQQSHKTKIKWLPLSEGQLRAGGVNDYSAIRAIREKHRQDSQDQKHMNTDFDIVWVHRNIVRKGGIDYVYYTLGTHYMLSEPILLREEYPHLPPVKRPYVLGCAILETHITYPEALAGLSANLQQEANDINNQRRDNVQLVLNRRYFARRGAQIDYRSLIRNIPGSVTEMNDIERDIKSEAPPEVTSSSYQEQDRINMDFDELTGSFSTSSISSNRQLNETVGGMEMMSADANDISEYQLRTFVVTWVEPVLKQIIQLEQRFETDEALLSLVGNKLKLWQRFGMHELSDRQIQGNMKVDVKVGFGATNPKQRVERVVMGAKTVISLKPEMMMRLDGDELADEVFGSLGYDSAARFFPPIDPANPPQQPKDPRIQVAEMNAQVKQMEFKHRERMLVAQLQQKQAESAGKLESVSKEAYLDRIHQMQLEQLRGEIERLGMMTEAELNTTNNKVKLAEVTMKLASMERLAEKDRQMETTSPPYEPPGRAPEGKSYTH